MHFRCLVFGGRRTRLWLLCAMSVALTAAGCSCGKRQTNDVSKGAVGVSQEKWGIKPVSIRLTAEDFFIDFRYRVIDPQKAKEVLRRDSKAYLMDLASGKVLPVPVTKLGPLRGIDDAPDPGRVYTVLFSNVNKTVEKGNRVTVVMGELRLENLTVE